MTTISTVLIGNEYISSRDMAKLSKRNAEAIAEHLNMLQDTDGWRTELVGTKPDVYAATREGIHITMNPRTGVCSASTRTTQLSLSLRAVGTTPAAALGTLAARLDEHIAECRQALITICKGATS